MDNLVLSGTGPVQTIKVYDEEGDTSSETFLPVRFSAEGVWVRRDGKWRHFRSEESLRGVSFSGR